MLDWFSNTIAEDSYVGAGSAVAEDSPTLLWPFD